MDDAWFETATWVQAVGTIAAVVGAAWIAAGDSRNARREERRRRLEAQDREARAALATKTAALNLAVLAATQIHNLHNLLRDEQRRGRVARVSPSRTLIIYEHMLTAFPIQSLGGAEAMVAFSYFPGGLATAAEIYANLETAVRAGKTRQPEVFSDYARQMGQLDSVMQRRLEALRAALELEAPISLVTLEEPQVGDADLVPALAAGPPAPVLAPRVAPRAVKADAGLGRPKGKA